MSRLFAILARHIGLQLVFVALITVVAIAGIIDPFSGQLKLRVDPSISRLLPKQDPAQTFYNQVRTQFGNDETVILTVTADDLLSATRLGQIEQLTDQLLDLPGVHHVVSITTATAAFASSDSLNLGQIRIDEHSTDEELAPLINAIRNNPLYAGSLITEDGKTTAVVTYFQGVDDQTFLEQDLGAQIRQQAERLLPGTQLHLTGSPVIKVATSEALVASMQFTLPTIAALFALVLLIAYRSLRAVWLPLLTIALALTWTLGALSWLGIPINLVTSIVPPLIITMGLAYGMHVLSEHFTTVNELSDRSRAQLRLISMLNPVVLPLVISGTTTAIGLLALALSDLPAIREFALVSAFGVGCTIILSLTFLPCMLALLPKPRRMARDPGQKTFTAIGRRLARANIRYRRVVIGIGLGVLLIAAAGLPLINVGTNYISGFPDDAQVKQDYEYINQRLGGANPFYIVVESHLEDGFIKPEFMRELADLQVWLQQQPEIGGSVSIADHLMLLNQLLQGKEHHRIPDDENLIKQLLLFGAGDETDAHIDNRFSTANIVVRAKIEDTVLIAKVLERIQERLSKLPKPLTATVTGNSILVTSTVDALARGQLESISLALVAIYLILSLLFTSWKVGAVALLPNTLPIAVYFGALGYAGINLSPTTSLIACVALGIAVDDTIHYLVRFNRDAQERASEFRATISALVGVIRPVTFTSLTLCLGFLALTGSDLQSQVEFGALAAFTMAVAWCIDLTLTPALASGFRIVTLWDSLRLDLGRDPQRSIPLFKGLSKRQSRVFALLSVLKEYPEQQQLITEGDASDGSVYVVIDGELDIWVQRDEERRRLTIVGRGAVVGEVGHFGSLRTANVESLSLVRVLKFNDDDLKRLSASHPRIAATVYRNLNSIQAERLARTTQLVK